MFDLIRRTFMIPRAPRVLSDQTRFDHLDRAEAHLERLLRTSTPYTLQRLALHLQNDQPLLAISTARAAAQRQVAIDLEQSTRKLTSPRSDGLYEIRMFGRVPVISRVFRLSPASSLPPSAPLPPAIKSMSNGRTK